MLLRQSEWYISTMFNNKQRNNERVNNVSGLDPNTPSEWWSLFAVAQERAKANPSPALDVQLDRPCRLLGMIGERMDLFWTNL